MTAFLFDNHVFGVFDSMLYDILNGTHKKLGRSDQFAKKSKWTFFIHSLLTLLSAA
jgi:hypothetical protein